MYSCLFIYFIMYLICNYVQTDVDIDMQPDWSVLFHAEGKEPDVFYEGSVDSSLLVRAHSVPDAGGW